MFQYSKAFLNTLKYNFNYLQILHLYFIIYLGMMNDDIVILYIYGRYFI